MQFSPLDIVSKTLYIKQCYSKKTLGKKYIGYNFFDIQHVLDFLTEFVKSFI